MLITTTSLAFAALITSFDISKPFVTIIQLQFASMQISWDSSRSEMMTRSSSATSLFKVSGVPAPTTTLPFTKYPCSLPATIFPSSVSMIFLYWVLASARIVLSYTSIYDFAISLVTISPSSLSLLLTTGRVTTLSIFIISHAFFMDRLLLTPSVLLMCISFICVPTSFKRAGVSALK